MDDSQQQPSGSQQQQPSGSQQEPSGSQQQPNVRSLEIEKSLEDVFHNFKKRREGLIKALTTDLERFLQECDPEKDTLCLFGLPNGLWEVSMPVEEVPPTLPEPILGINFARELIDKEEDWLLLIAIHSDSWLISVAFFCGAYLKFDKNDRNRLFQMINGLPTVFEVFSRKNRKKLSTTQSNVNKTKLSDKMQQPQSSEPRPKRVKMSRPPIEDSESDDDDDEDEYEEDEYEEEDSFCGACGDKYVINEFWIFCDVCETWFHGKCVKITPAMAEHIGLYKCPSCRTKRARVH